MGSRINVYSVELVRESTKIYDVSRQIKCPEDAYHMIEEIFHLSAKTKEHFGMLSLNVKNQVIGAHLLHVGTLNASIVHPRDVFQQALLNNAASLMIFHNHPSNNTTPSPEDIEVTKRLQEAGVIMGIELLDHLIVGEHTFTSLKERGYF